MPDAAVFVDTNAILAAAARGGCRDLLSEDLAAGQTVAGVTVRNPFA